MDKHRRVYAALVAYGFSGAKALEIVVDARRHDSYALWWVRFVCRRGCARG